MAANPVQIIYASTSGHTEYVAGLLTVALGDAGLDRKARCTRAEKAEAQTFVDCEVLVLASATWNTGGVEGQLNPYMAKLLDHKAKDVDLGGKPCACVALGDDRYFYTARAAEQLQSYVVSHHGDLVVPTLKVINEPYGQEDIIEQWATRLRHDVLRSMRSR